MKKQTHIPQSHRLSYKSEDFCYYCKEGGDIICCDNCPKVYHLKCLGSSALITRPKWSCPLHECQACGVTCTEETLVHCSNCPVSYCAEHAPEQPNFKHCSACETKTKRGMKKKALDVQEPSSPSQDTADEDDKLSTEYYSSPKQGLKRKRPECCEDFDISDQTQECTSDDLADSSKTPNILILNSIRTVLNSQRKLQKELASEISVSSSTISTYMNERPRKTGWALLETKLKKWLTKNERVYNANNDSVKQYLMKFNHKKKPPVYSSLSNSVSTQSTHSGLREMEEEGLPITRGPPMRSYAYSTDDSTVYTIGRKFTLNSTAHRPKKTLNIKPFGKMVPRSVKPEKPGGSSDSKDNKSNASCSDLDHQQDSANNGKRAKVVSHRRDSLPEHPNVQSGNPANNIIDTKEAIGSRRFNNDEEVALSLEEFYNLH